MNESIRLLLTRLATSRCKNLRVCSYRRGLLYRFVQFAGSNYFARMWGDEGTYISFTAEEQPEPEVSPSRYPTSQSIYSAEEYSTMSVISQLDS